MRNGTIFVIVNYFYYEQVKKSARKGSEANAKIAESENRR